MLEQRAHAPNAPWRLILTLPPPFLLLPPPASGSWVLLYTIEAIAILSVLNRYPNDAQLAVRVGFFVVFVRAPAPSST